MYENNIIKIKNINHLNVIRILHEKDINTIFCYIIIYKL